MAHKPLLWFILYFPTPTQDVVIICFAIDNHAGLANVKESWYPEITQHCPGVPIVLVGTKIDLRNDPETIENIKSTYGDDFEPIQWIEV